MILAGRDPENHLFPTPMCVDKVAPETCAFHKSVRIWTYSLCHKKQVGLGQAGIHPLREVKVAPLFSLREGVGDFWTAWKSCCSRGRGREFTPSLISSQVIPQLTPGSCTPAPDLIPLGFKSLQYSVTLCFILCQHLKFTLWITDIKFLSSLSKQNTSNF